MTDAREISEERLEYLALSKESRAGACRAHDINDAFSADIANALRELQRRRSSQDVQQGGDAKSQAEQMRDPVCVLKFIANAKRFDRLHFDDNSAFADWAQSLARHALSTPAASQDVQASGEVRQTVDAAAACDELANNIQWMKNVSDGTSTPVEALADMERGIARVRALLQRPRDTPRGAETGEPETHMLLRLIENARPNLSLSTDEAVAVRILANAEYQRRRASPPLAQPWKDVIDGLLLARVDLTGLGRYNMAAHVARAISALQSREGGRDAQDAARYRWLRDVPHATLHRAQPFIALYTGSFSQLKWDQADAAIDSAMSQGQGEQK
jgi:hypothetical protein